MSPAKVTDLSGRETIMRVTGGMKAFLTLCRLGSVESCASRLPWHSFQVPRPPWQVKADRDEPCP